MGIRYDAIPVIPVLERYGLHFEFAGDDELKVKCPFHDDHSPSCHVNTQSRFFKCHTASCEAKGDILTLLARFASNADPKIDRAVIFKDLSSQYDLEDEKICDIAAIERWHQDIWSADALRNELYRRGLNDDLIRYYRFGVIRSNKGETRITIPIPNRMGHYCNVRRYLPGAPGKEKMKNAVGFGSVPRWFPVRQLDFDTVVVCGGECKAVVAAYQLNGHGIGAITGTWGEQNIPGELLPDLKGKKVYVCLDIDEAGVKSAKKLATIFRLYADWVGILNLPLDPSKYPKGDINDFVYHEKGQLFPLLESVEQFAPEFADRLAEDISEPIKLSLHDAVHADNSRKRIKMRATVASLNPTPYIVPKDIVIRCPMDQKICDFCPIKVQGKKEFTIPNESPALLELANASSKSQLDVIKTAVGIPANCRVCEFDRIREYNLEAVLVSPQLEVTNRFTDRQAIPAFVVGSGLSMNESYEFTGKLLPDPHTQQATLLLSDAEPVQDALATYTIDNAEQLLLFQPKSWSVEDCEAKLAEIYNDFEANVTFVRQRPDLHLTIDLMYHSPLLITFDGADAKGWVEVLIVGDTRTGKSKTVEQLIEHYSLGHKVDCANMSSAGVLGGMEKLAERWFVSWGSLPRYDMRALFLEEFSTAPETVMPSIRETRASGVAKITKIGRDWQTQARTRLGVISNCVHNMKVSAYPHGVMAISELIGNQPDIARFDMAYIAVDSDVDYAVVHQPADQRAHVPHVYTGELCRQLILWAWTRHREQVIYTPEAKNLIYERAKQLSTQFSDAVPLVDKGSVQFKLARLSASIAARLFCCTPDFENIVVLPSHVELVWKLLQRLYTSTAFGYQSFSDSQKIMTELVDPPQLEAAIMGLQYPKSFCESMLAQDYIEDTDLADWNGGDVEYGKRLKSLFVLKHALMRRGKYYRKTPPFIELLKALDAKLASIQGKNPPEPPRTEIKF